jgi:predicted kinase
VLLLCYKPYMRKWMSDRLKRRKKSQSSKPAEPAQAPLQPAYFEADAPPADSIQQSMPEAEGESESEAGMLEIPEPQGAPPAALSTEGGLPRAAQNRPRRRRTRGGRGRGQKGQARAASQAAAATPPSAPSTGAAEPPAFPAEATPQATPSAIPRPPKGAVILAIGLPGSGKSSWFKRNNITPLSSDLLRQLLFDDAQEQRFQDLVFSNLRSMLKARLIARRPLNYVDATNLTPHERASWVKLAKDYGYEVQAVYFDVPLEVCLQRNRRRERFVDEDVMRRMASKLRPPTFEEGFSKVTVVRVKKKDDQAAS